MRHVIAGYLIVGLLLSGLVLHEWKNECAPRWPDIEWQDVVLPVLVWPSLLIAVNGNIHHNDHSPRCSD